MIALLLTLLSLMSGAGSHGSHVATSAAVAPLGHVKPTPPPSTGHPLAG